MTAIFYEHSKLKRERERERASTIQFKKNQIIIYDNITIVFIYLFLQKKYLVSEL